MNDEDDESILVHPRFGKFEFDGDAWIGSSSELRRFARCGWNERHVGDHLSPSYSADMKRIQPPEGEALGPASEPLDDWGRGPIKVAIESEDGERPFEAQYETLVYVMENEDHLLGRISDAANQYLRDGSRHGYWKWLTTQLGSRFDLFEELIRRPDGWLSLITFREVRISDKTRGKDLVIGFDCNCAWDGEHGFGVQLAKDRLVDVGPGTVGWNIYREEP